MPEVNRKVLIVIARLNVGGTAQYIGELVKGLQSHGYETLVATGHVQGAEREDEIVNQLPIRRVKNLGRKISLFSDLRARQEIARIIREFEPDLVYSHTFKAGLLTRTLKLDMPRIHAFHGHLLFEPELSGWKSQVVLAIERMLAHRAKLLITVGEKVAEELFSVRVGRNSQYRSIAPGVNPIKIDDYAKARRELGIEKESRPVVVWMARVTAVKAPQRVVEIARSIPEARFLLAGGGDMFEEISRSCPPNLTIVGWQPASRMWAVADLAISTSENEGMPVALIEAQLAGIPIVALDVGSVGEVIVDRETGYLFSEFDEQYIQKIRELISDPKRLSQMSRAAQNWANSQFAPEKMVNSHLAIFDEILA